MKPFLSTQPFSIVGLNENDFPSLEPIAICSPVVRFSGQIASQYRNETLFCEENIASKVSTKKKKLKRIGSAARRLSFLKKQLKIFLKKKKLRKKPIQDTSTTICEDPKPIEPSSPEEDDPMLNPSFSPDLSKRKYIYKDISTTAATTTTSVNPINWVLTSNWRFQLGRQSSSFLLARLRKFSNALRPNQPSPIEIHPR